MPRTSAAPTDTGAMVVPSYFPGKQWRQVLERDATADGQFVYAVKSTRIYCKPSCASRRPARKQVRFFPTPALAEAAGYRACKRCEPERTEAKADPQANAIAVVTKYLKGTCGGTLAAGGCGKGDRGRETDDSAGIQAGVGSKSWPIRKGSTVGTIQKTR